MGVSCRGFCWCTCTEKVEAEEEGGRGMLFVVLCCRLFVVGALVLDAE